MSLKLTLTTLTVIGISSILAACGAEVNTNTRNANANTNVNRPVTPVPSPTIDRTNSNVSRTDYDKNRAEYEKDRGSSTIGQGVNDSWIWFKTRAALATTDDLRDSTINVDVVNDVITLKGTVGTAAQKASAEKVAKTIEGQKGVKNELTVKPADSLGNRVVNGNTSGNRKP
ncbi:MAG TPA: BON domain-containing protein [Pyrinomonadaceae bacterium]|nr:BON domain-containing protein [Pyrinomonadaceae bacterium]